MKLKHLQARIAYCLALAECSVCPRRKFGAVIFDPETNTDVSAGYNGPPRGGSDGALCGVAFCFRDGAPDPSSGRYQYSYFGDGYRGVISALALRSADGQRHEVLIAPESAASFHAKHPPIPSGERTEIGCHHAEANAIANAARRGAALEGCAIVVTGEPCLACAKLIHHVGIGAVYCVKGGYAAGGAGAEYLNSHGVQVTYMDGPPDPRAPKEA